MILSLDAEMWHRRSEKQTADAARTAASQVAVLRILVPFGLASIALGFLTPDPTVAQEKEQLELQKLDLEIQKLKSDLRWSAVGLGLVGAGIGAAASIYVAQRARRGLLDQAVHQKRLERYPELVQAGSPLALYFPREHFSDSVLDRSVCADIGRKMSAWYFGGSGLLLSEESRDVYFLTMLALTRANTAPRELDVPSRKDYASEIDSFRVERYKNLLGIPKDWPKLKSGREYMKRRIDTWKLGQIHTDPPPFRDYVLLQALVSALRTSLTRDLQSRRLPV